MLKQTFLLILVILSLSACEKNEDKLVKYLVTDSESGFNITYRNNSGATITEEITVASTEDEWVYTFTAEKGDIVYVSTIYKDINSRIKVAILINGKVYKQASSKYDTISFVTVSGTIPY